MSDCYWTIQYLDGTLEDVLASIEIRNGCLHVVEHYGVTSGVKSERFIPLTAIRQWGRRDA